MENTNMQQTAIGFKLKTLREFQQKYPTSHVGGSIGLMIRGVDLHRRLDSSDLDITIDDIYDIESGNIEGFHECSTGTDFDIAIKSTCNDTHFYAKIDIRVNPEPSFEIVKYDGHEYNVSKLRDILFWKNKFAKKGIIKHIHDMIVIKGGDRPIVNTSDGSDPDLPF